MTSRPTGERTVRTGCVDAMPQSPKLFTCPQCKHRYLGHDPLPDCPRCGYDYRATGGFRWDVFMYLLVILALVSFFLVASFYHGVTGTASMAPRAGDGPQGDKPGNEVGEKLPGSGGSKAGAFQSPSREAGR